MYMVGVLAGADIGGPLPRLAGGGGADASVPDDPADAEAVAVVPQVVGEPVAHGAVVVHHEVDGDAFAAGHAWHVMLWCAGGVEPRYRWKVVACLLGGLDDFTSCRLYLRVDA